MPRVRPVDGEGRILLPAEFREELGIEAGTKVTVTLEDDEVRIVPGDQTTYNDLQRRGHGSPARTGVSKPDPPDHASDDATGGDEPDEDDDGRVESDSTDPEESADADDESAEQANSDVDSENRGVHSEDRTSNPSSANR